MAKLKGIFPIHGTLDGISFYTRKDVDGIIVRRANNLDAKRIRRDPAFEGTRRSNSEFRGATIMAKTIFKGLGPFRKTYIYPHFFSRLTGILRKLALRCKENPPGQRNLRLSLAPDMLTGLNLDKELAFSAICSHQPEPYLDPGRNRITLNFHGFDPGSHLRPPKGATHFQLTLAALAVSDLIFDPTIGYQPELPQENGLFATDNSGWIPLDTPPANLLSLTATLPGQTPLSGTTSLLALSGIRFAQRVSGDPYPLESHAAMTITQIFTANPNTL
jgi:hypothetical protein